MLLVMETLTVWTSATTAVHVDPQTLGLSRLELTCVGPRKPVAEVVADSADPKVVAASVRASLASNVREMESSYPRAVGLGIDQDIVMWLPYLRAAAFDEVREDELARLPADGRADRLRHECDQNRLSKLYMRRRSDGGIERPCGRSYFGGDVLWSAKHPNSVFDLEVSMTDHVENDLPVWRVDAAEVGSNWRDTRHFAVETKTKAMCRYGCEFVGRHAYIRCDGVVYDVLDLLNMLA
jgi:hypothetical protein